MNVWSTSSIRIQHSSSYHQREFQCPIHSRESGTSIRAIRTDRSRQAEPGWISKSERDRAMWWLSEVFSLVFNTLAFTSALIFLSVVVRCRVCQTLSILLVANSCYAGLVATGAGTAQALSMLCNRCYHSHSCVVQAYFFMIGCGAVFHSLCLQAFHRLVSNVCHTGTRHHRYSQSTQFCSLLLLLQWLFSTSSLLPAYKHIVFIPGSCLCQISFAEFASFLIVCLCIYIIPLSIIIVVVYLILWRYRSKRMSAAASHGVARRKNMRRERLMIKRIVCPLAILFVVGFPYVVFFVQAQVIQTAPRPITVLGSNDLNSTNGDGLSEVTMVFEE